jgi:hypothetical protein
MDLTRGHEYAADIMQAHLFNESAVNRLSTLRE